MVWVVGKKRCNSRKTFGDDLRKPMSDDSAYHVMLPSDLSLSRLDLHIPLVLAIILDLVGLGAPTLNWLRKTVLDAMFDQDLC